MLAVYIFLAILLIAAVAYALACYQSKKSQFSAMDQAKLEREAEEGAAILYPVLEQSPNASYKELKSVLPALNGDQYFTIMKSFATGNASKGDIKKALM